MLEEVNADKSKVKVLNGKKGLECEVRVDRRHLEHVSELKYLRCVLDESGTDKFRKKETTGRKVAGTIKAHG